MVVLTFEKFLMTHNLCSHQPKIEVLEHGPVTEAYASVGGLNKQIAQIRDLLEIPLTRPELFRHFGSLCALFTFPISP